MIEIRKEIREAIERTGRTNKQIALEMHVAQSNITNWTNGHANPTIEDLIGLANALNDYKFKRVVASTVLGIDLGIDNRVQDNLFASWFSAKKEERERQELSKKTEAILAVKPECLTREQKSTIRAFYKELDEEVSAEFDLLNRVKEVAL